MSIVQRKVCRKDIVESIIESTNISKKSASITLNTILSLIKDELANSKKSSIPQMGSLFVKARKPRKFKNIQTGQIQISSPRPFVAFRPSSSLLRVLNPINEETKQIKEETAGKKRKYFVEDGSNCKIFFSKPNPEQTADLRIIFSPIPSLVNCDTFPIILMPKEKSLLKLPRDGRSDVRGYKEKDFLQELKKANLTNSISVDMHMSILGRSLPYEPDFVLYDKSLNLYIDVEIDEPYDGYSRTPTHIKKGADEIRDNFFVDSGWVVVRFTEHQVHTNPNGCISTIRYIINSLQQKLGHIDQPCFVDREDRWDSVQAIIWERNLYREKYLGIQSFEKIVRNIKVICKDKSDKIESKISGSRPKIHKGVLSQKKTKKEETGRGLEFDEKNHIYYPSKDPTGNSDYISVTTLIEKFFPYFDVDAYVDKKMQETGKSKDEILIELKKPSERGTKMHEEIEKFLKGQEFDSSLPELEKFKKFYEECIIPQNLKFFAAEKVIELPEHNIAGTVDALFKKPNGEYVMIDWKRSKHLIIDGYPRKYGFGRGLSVLSHLDNSSYYKYEMQQSFYKYILENKYGMRISSMILVVLHPDYDHYYTIKLSKYREKEVKEIIEIHDQMLK